MAALAQYHRVKEWKQSGMNVVGHVAVFEWTNPCAYNVLNILHLDILKPLFLMRQVGISRRP